MSSNTQLPNWMVPKTDMAQADAWTGGARPIPDSGYYRAGWEDLSWSEQAGSFGIEVKFVSDDPVANGFTSKEYFDLLPQRKTDKQNNPIETDAEYTKRCNTSRGKFLGFVTTVCGFPEDWAKAQDWTPALIKQVFDAVKAGQAIPAGAEGHRELFYISFAKPSELQAVRSDGKRNYGQLSLMAREDWETSKATGKPPEYRTRGGQAETATQQAALPGSVTRIAAGGGAGAPLVVPAAGAGVPAAAGGGLPGAVAGFAGVPAAGAVTQAPTGVLPALPPGLAVPGR